MKRLFTNNFNETISVKNDVSIYEIQLRKLKLAGRWTNQQRSERRRVGIKNLTWLLRIIKQLKTD